MPVRLPISKLAASVVAPLQVTPRFTNELLQSKATWPQDVKYLRDTYMEIYALWDRLKEPAQDAELFRATEPLLRELLLGLESVSKELSTRTDILRDVTNAGHDLNVAHSYGEVGDFGMGTVYQSYCAMKFHRVLDTLTLAGNRKRAAREEQSPSKEQKIRMKELLKRGYNHVEAANLLGLEYTPMGKLVRKLAYGYDVSGEIGEQGGTNGQDKNEYDQGNSPEFEHTSPNPVSVAQDYEAEDEFPELAETKHKRVTWPPRTR